MKSGMPAQATANTTRLLYAINDKNCANYVMIAINGAGSTMTSQQLIGTDRSNALAHMLEGYDCPAILVSPDYQILASNARYQTTFGAIDWTASPRCFAVSHGYDRPCDQAGEACPLAAAQASGARERVLHIHQTPRGPEHVDVQMLPIYDGGTAPAFYVELLRPVPAASTEAHSDGLVGGSAVFNRMLEQVLRVGRSDAAVLLLGPSGSGKEKVARAIHDTSARASHPLVTVECSGLTESLFESELFGHVRGAFTGANYNRLGLVEAAEGGTLFLDEVGDIPLQLQVKLLRLIETGTFRPVGSNREQRANFRLICATHRDLPALVASGLFRQDLYFRINVFPLRVPSLAERRDDLPLLARALLRAIDPTAQYRLTETAMAMLRSHPFHGNIRELRNILTRATVLTDGNVIDHRIIASCLDIDRSTPTEAPRVAATPAPSEPEALDLKTLERDYLQRLLARHGDRARVAAIAGISVRSLYRKMQGSRDT
jgi:DNA-binding NtrC family response regulator